MSFVLCCCFDGLAAVAAYVLCCCIDRSRQQYLQFDDILIVVYSPHTNPYLHVIWHSMTVEWHYEQNYLTRSMWTRVTCDSRMCIWNWIEILQLYLFCVFFCLFLPGCEGIFNWRLYCVGTGGRESKMRLYGRPWLNYHPDNPKTDTECLIWNWPLDLRHTPRRL